MAPTRVWRFLTATPRVVRRVFSTRPILRPSSSAPTPRGNRSVRLSVIHRANWTWRRHTGSWPFGLPGSETSYPTTESGAPRNHVAGVAGVRGKRASQSTPPSRPGRDTQLGSEGSSDVPMEKGSNLSINGRLPAGSIPCRAASPRRGGRTLLRGRLGGRLTGSCFPRWTLPRLGRLARPGVSRPRIRSPTPAAILLPHDASTRPTPQRRRSPAASPRSPSGGSRRLLPPRWATVPLPKRPRADRSGTDGGVD